MTSNNKQAEDRAALELLLEIHGADRTRWPARERLRFASVISDDKAALRLVAEADALNRLLDRAPRESGAHIDPLKERIMAAALRAQRPQLAAIAGGKSAAPKSEMRGRRSWWGAASFSEWPAAAVLAASLVLGVMLGSAGTFDGTMQEMAQVAGFAASDADSSQLALSDDLFGQSDEDLL